MAVPVTAAERYTSSPVGQHGGCKGGVGQTGPLKAIQIHDRAGLDATTIDLLSPRELTRRSTLVFLSHKDRARNQILRARLRDRGIEVAYRRGALRLAPLLYNTEEDVDRALAVLYAE